MGNFSSSNKLECFLVNPFDDSKNDAEPFLGNGVVLHQCISINSTTVAERSHFEWKELFTHSFYLLMSLKLILKLATWFDQTYHNDRDEDDDDVEPYHHRMSCSFILIFHCNIDDMWASATECGWEAEIKGASHTKSQCVMLFSNSVWFGFGEAFTFFSAAADADAASTYYCAKIFTEKKMSWNFVLHSQ